MLLPLQLPASAAPPAAMVDRLRRSSRRLVMAGRICEPRELACEVTLPRRLLSARRRPLAPRSSVRLRPPPPPPPPVPPAPRRWSRESRSRSVACDWIEYCEWCESSEWRRDCEPTEMRRTALRLMSESSELRRRPKAPAAPTTAPRRVTNLGMAAAHADDTSCVPENPSVPPVRRRERKIAVQCEADLRSGAVEVDVESDRIVVRAVDADGHATHVAQIAALGEGLTTTRSVPS